jgi:integrase
VVTLRYLLDRYCKESATFLDNSKPTRDDGETRVKVLCAYFGEECGVRELNEDDVVAYTRWRLKGCVKYGVDRKTGKPKLTRAVRARSVESDLKLLYAALRWATSVRVRKGTCLLDHHPLQGVRRPREKNPKRPITTWERFGRARKAAQELTAEAEQRIANPKSDEGLAAAEADRAKWLRAELALVLLEATGRRSGSIRQLRWDDINLAASEITWRAEADKKRQQWITPILAALVEEIRALRSKLSVVGGWIFPSEKKPKKVMRRDVLARWILALEKRAGLTKLRWIASRISPEVGDGAEGSPGQGRGRSGRLEGRRNAAHVLPAGRSPDHARGHERAEEGHRSERDGNDRLTRSRPSEISNTPEMESLRKTGETKDGFGATKKPRNVSRCRAIS